MKVLFAIRDDSDVIDSLVRKYKKDNNKNMLYKEAKNFTAITREVQENNDYDRIVISDNVDEKVNNSEDREAILLKKLKGLLSVAKRKNGKSIPIIFICKNGKIAKSLMELKIYNFLLKKDAGKKNIYQLINNPRTGSEAKEYYRSIMSETTSIEKKKNEPVKKQVEVKAQKKEIISNKPETKPETKKQDSGYQMDEKLKKCAKYLNREGLSEDNYVSKFEAACEIFSKKDIKELINNLNPATKNILKRKSSKYNKYIPKEVSADVKEKQVTPEEPVEKKRGRGRPRKNPVPDENVATTATTGAAVAGAVKRGRGRPRKNPIVVETEETIQKVENTKKSVESAKNKAKNEIKKEENTKKIKNKVKEKVEEKVPEKIKKKVKANEDWDLEEDDDQIQNNQDEFEFDFDEDKAVNLSNNDTDDFEFDDEIEQEENQVEDFDDDLDNEFDFDEEDEENSDDEFDFDEEDEENSDDEFDFDEEDDDFERENDTDETDEDDDFDEFDFDEDDATDDNDSSESDDEGDEEFDFDNDGLDEDDFEENDEDSDDVSSDDDDFEEFDFEEEDSSDADDESDDEEEEYSFDDSELDEDDTEEESDDVTDSQTYEDDDFEFDDFDDTESEDEEFDFDDDADDSDEFESGDEEDEVDETPSFDEEDEEFDFDDESDSSENDFDDEASDEDDFDFDEDDLANLDDEDLEDLEDDESTNQDSEDEFDFNDDDNNLLDIDDEDLENLDDDEIDALIADEDDDDEDDNDDGDLNLISDDDIDEVDSQDDIMNLDDDTDDDGILSSGSSNESNKGMIDFDSDMDEDEFVSLDDDVADDDLVDLDDDADDDIMNLDEDTEDDDLVNPDEETEDDDIMNLDDDTEDDDLVNLDDEAEDDDLVNLDDEADDDDIMNLDDEAEDKGLVNLDDDADDDLVNLDDELNDDSDNDFVFDLDEDDDDLKINDKPAEGVAGAAFSGIANKNYNPNYSISKQLDEINDEETSRVPNVPVNQNNQLVTVADTGMIDIGDNQKVVAFVGAHNSGNSFIVNNLAQLLSEQGVKTAVVDLTKNKNSYYIYTENEETLRNIAYSSFEKLKSGIADGIKVNKYLTVYTALPNSDADIDDKVNSMTTLLNNYSLVLLDCDFDTGLEFFNIAQDIFFVQSFDILTIQALTSFIKKLKMNKVEYENKMKVVINKYVNLSAINERSVVAAMSVYNSPDTTYQLDLFDRNSVEYFLVPFEEKNYCKYLEEVVKCKLTIRGYSKNLLNSLNKLAKIVYPINGKKGKNK